MCGVYVRTHAYIPYVMCWCACSICKYVLVCVHVREQLQWVMLHAKSYPPKKHTTRGEITSILVSLSTGRERNNVNTSYFIIEMTTKWNCEGKSYFGHNV